MNETSNRQSQSAIVASLVFLFLAGFTSWQTLRPGTHEAAGFSYTLLGLMQVLLLLGLATATYVYRHRPVRRIPRWQIAAGLACILFVTVLTIAFVSTA